MDGYLDISHINYVLFHLSHTCIITDDIRSFMVFDELRDNIVHQKKIVFPLSKNPFLQEDVKTVNDIPVLFPCSEIKKIYSVEGDSVIFTDDILKSAFYLLSGYHEYAYPSYDKYNRTPFGQSIQKRLDIIHIPVVNYYFSAISEGIKCFCKMHNIPFEERKWFDTFGFFLSHDIDMVDKRRYRILGGRNAYWNFDFLLSVEKRHNIKSAFYFLPDIGKNNARYSFKEKRIRNIIKYLSDEGCETGIHGTIESSRDILQMQRGMRKLQEVSPKEISGCRQHYLTAVIPETAVIQEQCGIKYDTSLGFAAHEGFRNSYCMPFKLYDFTKKRMIDVWHFPLNVMDVTLFNYRNLSYEEIINSTDKMLKEIIKFNGTFSLLWHNSFFDEMHLKGITQFYISYIGYIMSHRPVSVTGEGFLKDILSEKNI